MFGFMLCVITVLVIWGFTGACIYDVNLYDYKVLEMTNKKKQNIIYFIFGPWLWLIGFMRSFTDGKSIKQWMEDD